MQTVFCSFSDSRSRVNLPEIPGDALSLYINANFLKVNLKVESLFKHILLNLTLLCLNTHDRC